MASHLAFLEVKSTRPFSTKFLSIVCRNCGGNNLNPRSEIEMPRSPMIVSVCGFNSGLTIILNYLENRLKKQELKRWLYSVKQILKWWLCFGKFCGIFRSKNKYLHFPNCCPIGLWSIKMVEPTEKEQWQKNKNRKHIIFVVDVKNDVVITEGIFQLVSRLLPIPKIKNSTKNSLERSNSLTSCQASKLHGWKLGKLFVILKNRARFLQSQSDSRLQFFIMVRLSETWIFAWHHNQTLLGWVSKAYFNTIKRSKAAKPKSMTSSPSFAFIARASSSIVAAVHAVKIVHSTTETSPSKLARI